MVKVAKKVVRKKKAVKTQKSIETRYPFTIIITIAALLLSLFVILSATQKNQDTRSRAQFNNCSPTIAEISLDAKEQELLQLLNAYRQENGVPPLTSNVALNRMSAWLTKDMDRLKYLDHNDSVGRTPAQRASECASPYDAENIANAQTTAPGVMAWWKDSESHKRNMLDPKYTLVGIANTGEYWVTDFAVSDTVNPVPTTGTAPTTPANNPTSPVPSPECLGACVTPNPTTTMPTITTAAPEQPTDAPDPTEAPEVEPTEEPEPTPIAGTPNPGSGGGGIIELFLGFLRLIFEFFASLFR